MLSQVRKFVADKINCDGRVQNSQNSVEVLPLVVVGKLLETQINGLKLKCFTIILYEQGTDKYVM